MNLLTLVLRGIRHHKRTQLGVVAGAAIATASLVGALVVGDSVRHSLGQRARARIGQVDAVLASHDRFFRAALADELAAADPATRLAPVIQLPGVVSTADGRRRLHDAVVYGVDERFFALAPGGAPVTPPAAGEAHVSARLARSLDLSPGDTVVLRVQKPSALPLDMPLALDDVSLALRLRVTEVLSDERFGGFGLRASQVPPATLFVPLDWLAAESEVAGRANLLLADTDGEPAEAPALLGERLREIWTLADAELELRVLEDRAGVRELRSSRVFLDDPVVEALEALDGVALTGILTYFVNEARLGERSTPYSMIAALGPLVPGEPAAGGAAELLPPSVGPGGIVLGRWIADDLRARPGDALALTYWVVDESRKLVERTHELRVSGVVELDGLAADRQLMPDFPGLADAENCRQWEPGVPVDLDRIRDEDEEYWDLHRGTPKAFVPLETGRALWANRFGSLTAVRFPEAAEAQVRRALRELDPGALGLFFRDVRTPALASASSPTDFGGLFVGLSFFLIVAALLLAALLFLFGVDQRSREIGLYAAVGFHPRDVRRVFLGEALVLALLGAFVGAGLGLAYTRVVLWALGTIWRDAVAGAALGFHARPGTVLLGMALSLIAVLVTVGVALRRRLKRPSYRLLTSERGVDALPPPGRLARGIGLAVAAASLLGALGIVLAVDPTSGTAAAGAFFGAGALVLVAGLLLCRAALHRLGMATRVRSVAGLGLTNGARRPGRSLATVAMMAIGTFLVVAVGANRQGPVGDEGERSSGTGGFALYGRSSLPVVHDLNTERGREAFGLSDADLPDVAVVPLRVRAGDDASCLSLARPRNPRLLGVDPASLAERGAFRFVRGNAPDAWRLLEQELGDGVIPAIGDATSLTWQLKKAVGDEIEYRDERGREVRVRIVGALADTILQGDLLIAEGRFEELFPSEGGYRLFLVDAPPEARDDVAASLTRALSDVGLALEGTGERLDAFHAVQNGYLAIFQLLGALGLLLGSAGLGMVVLRNTLERRAELVLAGALGFRRRSVRWWVLSEYGFLLALGLAAGGAAAVLAIVPAVRAPGSDTSLTNVLALLAVVAANGFVWIALAGGSAVRRAPIAALSEE